MNDRPTNWAGNYTYNAARWHFPETVADVQALAPRLEQARVIGSRHSFNGIADTTADLISLERFDQRIGIDRERHTVTVAAGVRYGQLCRQLDQAGYALHNLASLPHISVAGACATATHGSGLNNACLANAVSAMEIVTATGDVIAVSRAEYGAEFAGMVVGLGGLGVVTSVTLNVEPTFMMQQDVYENLPLAQLAAHFDEIMGSAYSVSLFTDWRADRVTQVWVKRRLTDGAAIAAEPTLFGATRATRPLHPIADISAVNCTPQLGQPGPWHERMPHFRMEFTPSSGAELQTEYLVPRRHALAAINAINGLREQIAPLLQVSEIRAIAADDLWMSPFYGQPCIGIHFTWVPDWMVVREVLPRIEAELAPFAARPHWGKLFTMQPERVQALFPKLPDFQRLLQQYDPQGKFRNTFLNTYIFGAPSA